MNGKLYIQSHGNLPNQQDLIFEIHPKIYYVVQEEQRDYLKRLRGLGEAITPGKEKEFAEKLAIEQQNNRTFIQNTLGKKVDYGQVLCLQHVKSGKYVSASTKASLVEKSGFQLSVESELDKGILFRVVPRYKLRTQGEPIPFGDDVTIEAVAYSMQLNFKAEGLHEFDEVELHRRKADLVPFPMLKDKSSKLILRYETYISQGVESDWQLE